MKKLLLLFFFQGCFLLILNAQINSKLILLEPSLNFAFISQDSEFQNTASNPSARTINFSFSTDIGYSISNNNLVGLTIGYGYSKANNIFSNQVIDPLSGQIINSITQNNLKTNSINAGLFYKRFFQITDRFYAIPQIHFIYNRSNSVGEPIAIETTSNLIKGVLSNDFMFQINPSLGLKAKVFYIDIGRFVYDTSITSTNSDGEVVYTDININPINWQFGAIFIFGKNKNN